MLRVLLILILLASWSGQAVHGLAPGSPPHPAAPQNRAPQTVSYIDVGPLYVGGSSATVNASSYFSDPDGDTLRYSVNSPTPSVATVSIVGSTVTIRPVALGTTGKIIVTARDPGGLTATQDFTVSVQNAPPPNRAPTTVGSISNVTLQVGGSSATRSVSGKFSDPDNDTLKYSVNSPNPSIVTVSISGSTVTIAPVGAGTTGKIIVTAKDPDGLTATQDFTATVKEAPPPPPVNRAPTTVGSIGDRALKVGGSSATVNVSSYFSDPDGDTLTYSVNSPTPTIATVSISGSTMTLNPVSAGTTARVIVTAMDPGGLTATQDFNIKVNGPPVASGSIANRTVDVGDRAFTVPVAGKFSDPNSDNLTFSALSSNTAAATVSESSGTLTITPKTGGTTTITVTATDPGGLKATLTFTVEVNRRPTTSGTLSNRTVNVGDSAFDVTVSGKFSDPDGDDLTFTARSSKTSVATVSESDGTVTVTPKAGGTTIITVSASDGRLSVSRSFTVKVNRRPTTSGTLSNRTVNVGDIAFDVTVSGKFSDPDGDDLTFTASSSKTSVATVSESSGTLTITPKAGGTTTITVSASDGRLSVSLSITVKVNRRPTTTGTLSNRTVNVGDSAFDVTVSGKFSDPDGDDLTFTARSSKTSVATVSESSGTLTITPKTSGTSTITVTATDRGGLKVSLTFTVTVSGTGTANHPPVVTWTIPDQPLERNGSVKSVNLSTKFSDPDNDVLTYSASSSDTSVAKVNVSGSTLKITPGTNGTSTVTVIATDPGGLTASQTPRATVSQAPVTIGTIPKLVLAENDLSRSIDVASYFSDPDNDLLSYDAVSSDSDIATATATGSTVTVTRVAPGTGAIWVTATDPGGLTVLQSMNFHVTNRAPITETSIANQTLYLTDDFRRVGLADKFSDPDGEALAYTATSSDTGIATVAAGGSTLRIRPVARGSTTVTVRATDPGSRYAEQSFTATVANQYPRIVEPTIGNRTLYMLGGVKTINAALYFTDPDGDRLSYAVTSPNPEIVAVEIASGTISMTPVALGSTGKIRVTATDPGGLTTDLDFNVTVVAGSPPAVTNRFPVAVGTISVDTLYVKGPFATIDVTNYFSDPDTTDVLAYTVASEDPGIVIVSISGNSVKITPKGPGETGKIVVTARDPGGLTADQDFTVTVLDGSPPAPPNRPPVARGTITVDTLYVEGSPVTFDVTNYFSDPDKDRLTYSAVSHSPGIVGASAVGSKVTLRPVAAGPSGKIEVTARDPGGLTAVQDFNVTVLAGAPPARTNNAPEIREELTDQRVTIGGGIVTLNVAPYFHDPDGDSLAYELDAQGAGRATVTIADSTLSIEPLALGTSGKNLLRAVDPAGLFAQQEFLVFVVGNLAPDTSKIIPDDTLTVAEGPVVLDLSTFFFDPDKDTLTFTAESSDTLAATVAVSGDRLTITPVEKNMSSTVTVTASDGDLSVEEEFKVTVNNSRPEVSDSITGRTLTVAEGSVELDLSDHFSDADGDDLSYEAVSSNTNAVTVVVSGDTLTTRPVAKNMSSTVKVTASDGELSVEPEFEVTVENSPPEVSNPFSGLMLTVGDSDATVTLSDHFSDPDGDDLMFEAVSSDTNAVKVSVSDDSLAVTPRAAGESTVDVEATDDDSASASQSFTVMVEDETPPPPEPCPATIADAPIRDQTLFVGAVTTRIDLTQHFEHIDQDVVEIMVTSPSPDIAKAAIEGTGLKIDPVAAGRIAKVTVTVSDPTRAITCTPASQSFMITVKESGHLPWSVTGDNVYRLEGNVGIGVEVPDQKLVVDGKIKAEEYRLTMIPADYVFESDYDLMSLEAVARYIRRYGHLPGVPSGAEMTASGIGVSRMQTLLLEKIEELSLHVIGQHEQLRAQGQSIDAQQWRNKLHKQRFRQLEHRLERLER